MVMNFQPSNSFNWRSFFTVVGAIAIPVTALLSARSAIKAKEAYDELPDDASKGEIVKTVAKECVPAIISLAVAEASVLGSNGIATAQIAGLSAAGLTLESNFRKYRKGVIDYVGEEEEKKICQEIGEKNIIEKVGLIDGETIHLFHEPWTGAWFQATKEQVLNALSACNRQIIDMSANKWNPEAGIATIAHIFKFLKKPELITEPAEKMGWSLDLLSLDCDCYWLELGICEQYDNNGQKFYELYSDWDPAPDLDKWYEEAEAAGRI